jgi:lambda repressor-like predicted transcriptional regulator
MENRKIWVTIPLISALVLAIAIGVLVFSSSSAANAGLTIQAQDDGTAEPIPWKGGFGGFPGFDRGGRFGPGNSFDYDAFIAEELGVSVADLQAARQAAQEAALDQAVTEGVITAEQADLIKARQALRQYINNEEILASVLGITTEELETARQEGKSLQYLFGELGLEPADIQSALQTAYEDALQQAIADSVITDSQAEQLQQNGFGGRGLGAPGFGFHGRGGFHFQIPSPSADNGL